MSPYLCLLYAGRQLYIILMNDPPRKHTCPYRVHCSKSANPPLKIFLKILFGLKQRYSLPMNHTCNPADTIKWKRLRWCSCNYPWILCETSRKGSAPLKSFIPFWAQGIHIHSDVKTWPREKYMLICCVITPFDKPFLNNH